MPLLLILDDGGMSSDTYEADAEADAFLAEAADDSFESGVYAKGFVGGLGDPAPAAYDRYEAVAGETESAPGDAGMDDAYQATAAAATDLDSTAAELLEAIAAAFTRLRTRVSGVVSALGYGSYRR